LMITLSNINRPSKLLQYWKEEYISNTMNIILLPSILLFDDSILRKAHVKNVHSLYDRSMDSPYAIDYRIRGIKQQRVYHTKLYHIAELKQRLLVAWHSISQVVIAIDEWRYRLHAIVSELTLDILNITFNVRALPYHILETFDNNIICKMFCLS